MRKKDLPSTCYCTVEVEIDPPQIVHVFAAVLLTVIFDIRLFQKDFPASSHISNAAMMIFGT